MTEKSGIRKPYREFTKRNIPKLCKELQEYLEPLLLQRGVELDFGRIRFTGKEIVLETRIIKEGSMSVLHYWRHTGHTCSWSSDCDGIY